MRLALAACGVLIANLPFGYWRAGTRRMSAAWFAAVHLPIPLAVGIRLLTGVGWSRESLPAMVAAYFAGQFLGGALRQRGVSGRQKQEQA